MTALTSELRTGRSLIEPALFERLVKRIAHDHNKELEDAALVMDQALAFLAACAANPGVGLGPSDQVDIGWHTFVLYTREYAAFCKRIAGRFVHHVPDDESESGCHEQTRVTDTIDANSELGFVVDRDLWSGSAKCDAKCSQCHQGCTDSN